MNTISRFEMKAILDYLECALSDSQKLDLPTYESNLTWRIRMARDRLLNAAINTVEVEAA